MKLSRFDALCDLSQRLARRLEQELQAAEQDLAALERQQRGLQSYAAEYARSMNSPVERGPQLLSLRHDFTTRLRGEAETLRKQIQSRKVRLDELRGRVRQARARTAALDSVSVGRRQNEQQARERHEQKQLDELAAQMASYRSPVQ